MNVVVLKGRLASDPVLRYTRTSNIPVVGFSIAVNRRYSKDKEQPADFFNCVAWQGTAEFVNNHFTKGQPICLEGRLQLSKWVDDAKNTRYSVEVVAESVDFAGFKREDSNNAVAVKEIEEYDPEFDDHDDYFPYEDEIAA